MTTDCNKLDTVFRDFLTLKKLRRTGWQLRGIREGESIADHCFGVVLLTHLLVPEISNPQINREKAVAMAIIHELGETRIGDIPYTTLKYFPDKSKMEYDAITDVLEPLSAHTKEETLKLFVEFEEGKTTEARFVKAIDKLEMLVTAAEYEKAGFSGLTDFWENPFTFKVFEEFQPLAQYAKYLLSKRRQRVNGEL
ncbi:HD family hydrolase [bacterium]|nr:HD family hydrolase [bacterium]